MIDKQVCDAHVAALAEVCGPHNGLVLVLHFVEKTHRRHKAALLAAFSTHVLKMNDLTEAVRHCLLVAPKNFKLGHLVKIVLCALERYNKGRNLSDFDLKNAFDNLLEQVAREAEEQDIIDFVGYTQLMSIVLQFPEQVEDIRLALLETMSPPSPPQKNCVSPCFSRKK